MAELTEQQLDEFLEYAQRAEEWAARYAIRSLLTEVERLQNLVVLLRAEKDAANSLLLDVQQDCVRYKAQRDRAIALFDAAVVVRSGWTQMRWTRERIALLAEIKAEEEHDERG